MIRLSGLCAVCILAAVLSGLPAPASDAFLSTRCEAQAGYEKNRLEEAGSGEGSPFWEASPGIEVVWFGSEAEAALFVDYRRTQYTESGFESKDAASAFARWRYLQGQNEAGANAGVGLYRDKALPDDDHTFWQARPYVVHTLEDLPAELSLKMTLRQTFYDVSIYTSATDRTDIRLDVRPGLRWHLSHRVTVWAELYAEHNVSDASEAEYSGFGGAAGVEIRPAARLDLGVWSSTGTRPYAESVEGESRRDTPASAGATGTYRLRPWLELFCLMAWESYASTIEEDDYSWWRAGGGLRVVMEHEAGGK